jgi:hypothetical protein
MFLLKVTIKNQFKNITSNPAIFIKTLLRKGYKMILIRRYPAVLIVFFLLAVLASSCKIEVDNLTESKAEAILNNTYSAKLESICALDKALSGYPEFVSMKDENFCKARFVITDISYISHSAVNTAYKIVITPEQEASRKWLDAIDRLEGRLKDSPEWEKLEEMKQKISEQLGKKVIPVEEGKTNFTHYDFGWSVVGGSR